MVLAEQGPGTGPSACQRRLRPHPPPWAPLQIHSPQISSHPSGKVVRRLAPPRIPYWRREPYGGHYLINWNMNVRLKYCCNVKLSGVDKVQWLCKRIFFFLGNTQGFREKGQRRPELSKGSEKIITPSHTVRKREKKKRKNVDVRRFPVVHGELGPAPFLAAGSASSVAANNEPLDREERTHCLPPAAGQPLSRGLGGSTPRLRPAQTFGPASRPLARCRQVSFQNLKSDCVMHLLRLCRPFPHL